MSHGDASLKLSSPLPKGSAKRLSARAKMD